MTAILLTDAELQHAASSEQGARPATTALARWQLPNGQQHSAPLWVGVDCHSGDRVPIWINQRGNRADPPETPGYMIANALVIGVSLVLGGWVGGCCWAHCGGPSAAY